MEKQMITKILLLLIVGLLIVIFSKRNEKFKAVVTGKMFKIVSVVIGKIFKIVVVAVLVVLVLTALSFNVFADEIKVKDIQELGVVSAKDYEVKSTPIEYSLKDSLEKGNVFDARNFTDESRTEETEVIKEVEENTEDSIKGNINLVDIMEQVQKNGFSIITMHKVKVENNRFINLGSASFTTIEFNDEININNGTEDLKLKKLVFDIVEDKIVPIYQPKVNYVQAILRKHVANRISANTIAEKYGIPFELQILLEGGRKNTDGIKGDIDYLIYDDLSDGVDYEALKKEFGINDDYIKYVIEPIGIYNYISVTIK